MPDCSVSKMPRKLLILITGWSLAKLCIHLLANNNYGLNADELYYISLSKHLQWGYLDNSPFIAFVTRFSAWCFGQSVFTYRLFPTLFSAFTVFVTGLSAYHLGGKKLAISIACIAMICSPASLATSYFLEPVVFEQFFWVAGAYLLLRYVQTNRMLFLYLCAIDFGIGFLNKYTILIYPLALAAGILVSKTRNVFLTKKLILPALLGFAIILPNLLWQIQHHFPVIHYTAIVKEQIIFNGAGDFLFQFLFFHGGGMAVWLAGLGYLLLYQPYKNYRFIAWAFIFTTAALLLLHGKIYYGLGTFPMVFAAGGTCWEKIMAKRIVFWRYSFFALLVIPAIFAFPAVLPVLPFTVTLQYFKLMNRYTSINEPLRWADGKVHKLPQSYADMFGWQEVSDKAMAAYNMLDNSQKNDAVILTENYAIAGAINYFGATSSVPVISSNNSFILWSPVIPVAENVIYVTRKNPSEMSGFAQKVKLMGTVSNKFAHENGTRIYLLYKPSKLLKQDYKRQRDRFL